MVTRVIVGEWSINRYAMNGPCGVNFMVEFGALKGQLDLGGEWRRGSRWKRLGVCGHGQFFDVLF